MQLNKTCAMMVLDFQKKHKAMRPDSDGVIITKELWEEWKTSGNNPPDIDKIAADYAKHENGFFYELVNVAEKTTGEKLNIHFCQFSLEQYNTYALSATDGYIVLVDDVFMQMLYFVTNILVFDTMNLIQPGEEMVEAKTFVQDIIETNYFPAKTL